MHQSRASRTGLTAIAGLSGPGPIAIPPLIGHVALLHAAIRRGEITPAKVCQARMQFEASHRWPPREVHPMETIAWLCAKHHRRAHASRVAVETQAGRGMAGPKLN